MICWSMQCIEDLWNDNLHILLSCHLEQKVKSFFLESFILALEAVDDDELIVV